MEHNPHDDAAAGPTRVAVPVPVRRMTVGGGRRPRRKLRVFISPSERRDVDPVVTVAETLDPYGITVRVRDTASLEMPDTDEDVRPLAVAFCDAYGPRSTLKIAHSSQHLWSGTVNIEDVEVVPDRPGELLVGFGFGRELAEYERRALGL